jgi:YD repeat-containing protein
MKFYIIFFLFILSAVGCTAQYYYSDIVGTKQTNQQYKLLRSFQTKKITAISYEGNQPSKDFVLEQTITGDGRQIITRSASIGNAESFFRSSFTNNRVSQTVDSSRNAINTVTYEYDNAGRVVAINSTSKDFDGTFTSTEWHQWKYDEKGHPSTMLKIKNKVDTTLVEFKLDEDGNVAEEHWRKNNWTIETYYYYYNAKKQLTDIVRYSRKAKQMLPDYMFEYDNNGHISQMTQTQSGSANYLTWKYVYNENGMKQQEVVYNKQKEYLGKIEYSYQ